MRVRLPLGRTVFFMAALVLALVALLPLRLAASWFALDGKGLSAREATGSLWAGALKEARFGDVALGDLGARLNLLPLFLGRARLSLSRDEEAGGRLEGAVLVTRHGFALEEVSGRIQLGGLFAPAPLTALDLEALTAEFVSGNCEHAEGQVRAAVSGDAGGVVVTAALGGAARCEQGALLLPLAGQSGLERLDLKVEGDGRWRIELALRPSDPAMQARLVAAGFAPGAGGFVRRIEGNF